MAEEIKPIAELVGGRPEYRDGRRLRDRPGPVAARAGGSTTPRSPTTTRSSRPAPSIRSTRWTADDRRVYDLVVRRFLAAFHPEAVLENTRVETTVAEHVFRTRGKVLLVPGLARGLHGGARTTPSGGPRARPTRTRVDEQALPRLERRQAVAHARGRRRSPRKKTKPPRRYSDASLLGRDGDRRQAWSTTRRCARR